MSKRLGYVLKRAQHALRTSIDDELNHLGLTTAQYNLLSAVAVERGISNASLARMAFVTAQSMQGIVANLEKQGKCQQGDVSAQAPQSWVTRYYPFYNSSWYKSTIVPKSAQGQYSGYMSTFGAANVTEIAQEAPAAKYVDSNGNIVTGADAGVSGDGMSIGGHDGGSGGGGGDGGGDGGGGHGGGGGE